MKILPLHSRACTIYVAVLFVWTLAYLGYSETATHARQTATQTSDPYTRATLFDLVKTLHQHPEKRSEALRELARAGQSLTNVEADLIQLLPSSAGLAEARIDLIRTLSKIKPPSENLLNRLVTLLNTNENTLVQVVALDSISNSGVLSTEIDQALQLLSETSASLPIRQYSWLARLLLDTNNSQAVRTVSEMASAPSSSDGHVLSYGSRTEKRSFVVDGIKALARAGRKDEMTSVALVALADGSKLDVKSQILETLVKNGAHSARLDEQIKREFNMSLGDPTDGAAYYQMVLISTLSSITVNKSETVKFLNHVLASGAAREVKQTARTLLSKLRE